jgi:hypothetical protein
MKWIEAAKEGQGYVLSAELKERRDTIEAKAAEVLKKSGATPCTLYGIVDGLPVVSSVEIGIKDGEDYMLLHPCARWWKVAEFKLLKMLPVYPECNGYMDVCNDEPACITEDSTAEDVEAWRAFNQRRAERYEQARQLAIANYRVYNEAMAQVCPGFKGSGPGYTQTSSVIRSGMRFTARYFKHEGTTFSMELKHGTKATPDGFKLISANYYGKEGHERLRKDIDFLDEIDAAIEEGDMSQAHQLVGDWRKELDDYLALNEKECGTHDDGAGDEAAVAKTKE